MKKFLIILAVILIVSIIWSSISIQESDNLIEYIDNTLEEVE